MAEDNIINGNGDLAGQTVCLRAYLDERGGLLAVEYPNGKLDSNLAAAIMGNVIKDTLGAEPDLRDVVAMQRSLMATLQGGESAGTRTK